MNQITDVGCKTLAECLQVNTELQKLYGKSKYVLKRCTLLCMEYANYAPGVCIHVYMGKT
jgi:hypothetical protein